MSKQTYTAAKPFTYTDFETKKPVTVAKGDTFEAAPKEVEYGLKTEAITQGKGAASTPATVPATPKSK